MRLVIAALAALLTVGTAPALADGSESFGESFRGTFRGAGVVSAGAGLSVQRGGGTGSGTITIGGMPDGARVERAFLYWASIGARDSAASLASSSVQGTEIGFAADTCWVFPIEEQRNFVYRADVTSLVTGNGSYAVSGVGDVAGADGQGASLVVVYGRANASHDSTVIVNDGAMHTDIREAYQEMSHTFAGITQPRPALAAVVHVGFGDGQAADPNGPPVALEGPLMFAGSPASAPNDISGSSGPFWDDRTYSISPALLSGGSALNSIRTDADNGDCLLWAYAALEYSYPRPPMAVEPGSLDFGFQALGVQSAARTVTVLNEGTAPFVVSRASLSGPNSSDFSVQTDTCTGASLPPAGSCALGVAFAPGAAGPRAAALEVVSDAGERSEVSLGGIGEGQAPVSTFTTRDLSVLLGFGPRIDGTVTDDLSGVGSETVTFRSVGGLVTRTVNAQLTCTERTSCSWSAIATTTNVPPGVYTVTAQGTDNVGNVEAPGPSITVVLL